MKKIFILSLFCLLAPSIFGVEIFVHKIGEKKGFMCQAVRLKDNWFLTAAHCVVPYCDGYNCEAEIPLPNGNVIKAAKQDISWLNDAKINKTYYDIALIKFDTSKYSLPAYNPVTVLIIKDFNFDTPKILKRSLEITFSSVGEAGQILSRSPVLYGPNNKIIFTEEMGLFHGVSGAGVMTNKVSSLGVRELISVVSGVASNGGAIKFSVFSVFDEKVKDFLRPVSGLSFSYLTANDFSEVGERYKEAALSLDNTK